MISFLDVHTKIGITVINIIFKDISYIPATVSVTIRFYYYYKLKEIFDNP